MDSSCLPPLSHWGRIIHHVMCLTDLLCQSWMQWLCRAACLGDGRTTHCVRCHWFFLLVTGVALPLWSHVSVWRWTHHVGVGLHHRGSQPPFLPGSLCPAPKSGPLCPGGGHSWPYWQGKGTCTIRLIQQRGSTSKQLKALCTAVAGWLGKAVVFKNCLKP